MLPRLILPPVIFLLLQLLATIALGQPADSPAPQRLTREEVRVYTGLLGAPAADVIETYRKSPNEGDRADAEDYLRRTVREVVWSRRVAAEAVKAGFEAPEAHVRTVKERYRDCTATAWLTAKTDATTTLTLEQLKGVVQRHKSLYRKPERREVRYIFMQVADGAGPKAEEEVRLAMEAVRREIESGQTSFASAAKQHSEAPSSKDGGLIGAVDRESGMNAKFLDLVFSTAQETMSPVTRLKNGYYIVRVEAIYAGRNVTDEQIATDPGAQRELLTRYQGDLLSDLKSSCYKKHPEATSELDAACREAEQEGFVAPDCVLRQKLELDRLRAYYYHASLHEQEWKPSEEEIRRYYEAHPAEMKEAGCFILTKLFVPVFAADRSTIRSRAQASEVARQARQALIDGATTETLTGRFASAGLQVLNHKDWVMSTGDRATDLELLRAGPGFISEISLSEEGVAFFMLHERRELPLLPLETKRAYISRNVEHLNKIKSLEKVQEELVASMGGWEGLLPE